jgi:hypothetical protein
MNWKSSIAGHNSIPYRESVNRCDHISAKVIPSAETALWAKTPATAHLGLRPAGPGSPYSPRLHRLGPRPSPPFPSDVPLPTPVTVGAGERRGPAACAGPAARRPRLSESELRPLRRRSMTPSRAAGLSTRMSAGPDPPPPPPRVVPGSPPVPPPCAACSSGPVLRRPGNLPARSSAGPVLRRPVPPPVP